MKDHRGFFYLLFSSLCFTIMNLVYKYFLSDIDRGVLLLTRGVVGASLALFVIKLSNKKIWPVPLITFQRSFLSSLALYLLLLNFNYTTVANATFFQSLSFIPVMIGSLRLNFLSRSILIPSLFLFIGLFGFFSNGNTEPPLVAIGVGLLCAFVSSLAVTALKHATYTVDPWVLVFYFCLSSIFLGGATANYELVRLWGLNNDQLLLLIVAGIMAFSGQSFFTIGAKKIDRHIIIPTNFSLIIFTAIFEFFWKSVVYTEIQIASCLLIFIAVFLLYKKSASVQLP